MEYGNREVVYLTNETLRLLIPPSGGCTRRVFFTHILAVKLVANTVLKHVVNPSHLFRIVITLTLPSQPPVTLNLG